MERILITGAAGFIGANLARDLIQRGFDVIGLDNLSAGVIENVPSEVEFHVADITHDDLGSYFGGVSTVFHLAARNCIPDCALHPEETFLTNVIGTANVCATARASGVSHLVYADTAAEYEGIEEFPSAVERVRPLSVYARSKHQGEAAARASGLLVTTLRYFNVYGPGQDHRRAIPPLMSALVGRLLAGQRPRIYGDGKKSRDFIHVDDVNAFHLKLLREPELRGGTYNLGSGRDYSVLDVLEIVEKAIGVTIAPEFLPELPEDANRTLARIDESMATGWAPGISLEKGISDFVAQYHQRFQQELEK